MLAYCQEVRKLEGTFDGLELTHVHCNDNSEANELAKMGSRRTLVPIGVFVQQLHQPTISEEPAELAEKAPEAEVFVINPEWTTPYLNYLLNDELLEDRAEVEEIALRMTNNSVAIACGQPLNTSAALYQRCALLVGPDSGAAHLAAAVGTPTVRLYGPAPVDVFGPWPPHAKDQRVLVAHELACVPCGHLESPPCGATTLPACMLALGVEDVLKAVKAQLHQG